jgi:hypothetical protein
MFGQKLLISLELKWGKEFTTNPRVIHDIEIFPTDETVTHWTRTVTMVKDIFHFQLLIQELKALRIVETHHVGTQKRSDGKRSNKSRTNFFARQTQVHVLRSEQNRITRLVRVWFCQFGITNTKIISHTMK